MNAHVKENLSKANNSQEWTYNLDNRTLKLLAYFQRSDRQMLSARFLSLKYGVDGQSYASAFRSLRQKGLIEKFNSKQWQLTENGKRFNI